MLLWSEDHVSRCRVDVLGLQVCSTADSIMGNVLPKHVQLHVVHEAWILVDVLNVDIEEHALIVALNVDALLVVCDGTRIRLHKDSASRLNCSIVDEDGGVSVDPSCQRCGHRVPSTAVLTLEDVELEAAGVARGAGVAVDAGVLEVEAVLRAPALRDVRVTPEATLLEAAVFVVANLRAKLAISRQPGCRCRRGSVRLALTHVLARRLRSAPRKSACRLPVHSQLASESAPAVSPLKDVVGAATHLTGLPGQQSRARLGDLVLLPVQLTPGAHWCAGQAHRQGPGGSSIVPGTSHDLVLWDVIRVSPATAPGEGEQIRVTTCVAHDDVIDRVCVRIADAELPRGWRIESPAKLRPALLGADLLHAEPFRRLRIAGLCLAIELPLELTAQEIPAARISGAFSAAAALGPTGRVRRVGKV